MCGWECACQRQSNLLLRQYAYVQNIPMNAIHACTYFDIYTAWRQNDWMYFAWSGYIYLFFFVSLINEFFMVHFFHPFCFCSFIGIIFNTSACSSRLDLDLFDSLFIGSYFPVSFFLYYVILLLLWRCVES